jgi:endonuclease/exonuclease/phosphatase family metal-dependent hydrolase
MGDINEWRGGARLLRHLNTVFTPLPTARTFPSCFPVFRLDRVWAHHLPNVGVQRIKTPTTRKLSDHLPLLINVVDIR